MYLLLASYLLLYLLLASYLLLYLHLASHLLLYLHLASHLLLYLHLASYLLLHVRLNLRLARPSIVPSQEEIVRGREAEGRAEELDACLASATQRLAAAQAAHSSAVAAAIAERETAAKEAADNLGSLQGVEEGLGVLSRSLACAVSEAEAREVASAVQAAESETWREAHLERLADAHENLVELEARHGAMEQRGWESVAPCGTHGG